MVSEGGTPVIMGGNDGFSGMGIWGFLIIALFLLGGFGGFGNNARAGYADGFANAIGYENLATSNEVQRGFDNQNSMANQREILAAVNAGTAQSVAATNQTFHDTLSVLTDKYGELQRDIAALAVGQANALANQNACCCDTKMLIQQSNYDAAIRDANTNANLTAQIQSVKDMIANDKIESLQSKVSELQLANAMSGVVRYPQAWTYNAGMSPFCGCNCGC